MAPTTKAPSAVRARVAGLVILSLLLFGMTGCRHRRSALRPIIIDQPPAAIMPGAIGVEPAAPTITTEPALEGPTDLAPVAPPADSEVKPSATPLGPDDDEPPLRTPTGNARPSTRDTSPPAPTLDGPVGSVTPASATRRASGNARVRRSQLRAQLEPFVNDPIDLFTPPKADRPWQYIVLHHSARPEGGYDQIDAEHRKALGFDGCGYHFIIGNGTGSGDGQIEVARRWSNQKAGVHCRDAREPDASEYGIGICLVGDLENAPPTEKQLEAARALVAYLADRYQIPAAHIASHAHVSSRQTVCPGRYFPKESILGHRAIALR